MPKVHTKVRWVNPEKLETAIDVAGCTITFRLNGENADDIAYEPYKPKKGYIEAARGRAEKVLLDHQQRNLKRSA